MTGYGRALGGNGWQRDHGRAARSKPSVFGCKCEMPTRIWLSGGTCRSDRCPIFTRKRSTIRCRYHMGAQETAIVLNKELAQGYLKALTELRDTHDDISVMSIARMPDVLVSELRWRRRDGGIGLMCLRRRLMNLTSCRWPCGCRCCGAIVQRFLGSAEEVEKCSPSA